MVFGIGNPGRPKGITNKLNIDIREKFYRVYDNMGIDQKQDGDTAFLVWARSHKKVFYSLFAKLAPTNLNINDSREHESFIDRMAKEMLLREAQVIEAKQLDTNQDNMSIKDNDKSQPIEIKAVEASKVISHNELES